MNGSKKEVRIMGVVSMEKITETLKGQIPAVTSFGINVILAVLVFYIGGKIIRLLLKFIRGSLEKSRIDKGVAQFACSLSRFFLYALLIFNIAMRFGVKESSVAALLGTAGVTVGLALQGGLANVAGGLMLLLFKPFQVGDYIIQNQQMGCEGTVTKIDICYTTLLSVDNKHVIIPNGTLSNSTITNVTARDQRKLEIKVGISYDSDIRKAKKILEMLLNEDPDTRSDEEMVVFVDSLGESSVLVGLRVWVPTDKYWPIEWRLNERIKEEFDRNGIVIPYNRLEVFMCNEKQEKDMI